jgi:hypothetical protein
VALGHSGIVDRCDRLGRQGGIVRPTGMERSDGRVEVTVGIEVLHPAVLDDGGDDGRPFATSLRTEKEPVLPPHRPGSQRVLGWVI